jgi:gamma-butyrobetaine dioxygenase
MFDQEITPYFRVKRLDGDSETSRVPPMIVDQLETLFQEAGQSLYFGEAVTEAQHGLQCAALAVAAQAAPEEVAAALLHDVGHLLHGLPESIAHDGIDGHHEDHGASFLAAYFPVSVVDPIRLHVAAKRYLATVEPEYAGKLSAASQRSLELQGGPMSEAERHAFEQEPHFASAVRLRRWDDTAKNPDAVVPEFRSYRPLLLALLQTPPCHKTPVTA